MRYKLVLYEQVSQPDGYGSSKVSYAEIRRFFASRKVKTSRENDGGNIVNYYTTYEYYIRAVPGMDIKKNSIVYDGKQVYQVKGINKTDTNPDYYKLSCETINVDIPNP